VKIVKIRHRKGISGFYQKIDLEVNFWVLSLKLVRIGQAFFVGMKIKLYKNKYLLIIHFVAVKCGHW
jgi:hypothetical protein